MESSDLARDHALLPGDSIHAASAILWKADAIQAWDRDFSCLSHLIAIEAPAFITKQDILPGMERARIAPSPDEFKKSEPK